MGQRRSSRLVGYLIALGRHPRQSFGFRFDSILMDETLPKGYLWRRCLDTERVFLVGIAQCHEFDGQIRDGIKVTAVFGSL